MPRRPVDVGAEADRGAAASLAEREATGGAPKLPARVPTSRKLESARVTMFTTPPIASLP